MLRVPFPLPTGRSADAGHEITATALPRRNRGGSHVKSPADAATSLRWIRTDNRGKALSLRENRAASVGLARLRTPWVRSFVSHTPGVVHAYLPPRRPEFSTEVTPAALSPLGARARESGPGARVQQSPLVHGVQDAAAPSQDGQGCSRLKSRGRHVTEAPGGVRPPEADETGQDDHPVTTGPASAAPAPCSGSVPYPQTLEPTLPKPLQRCGEAEDEPQGQPEERSEQEKAQVSLISYGQKEERDDDSRTKTDFDGMPGPPPLKPRRTLLPTQEPVQSPERISQRPPPVRHDRRIGRPITWPPTG